ncbi:MAG: hypothetical protein LBU51_03155 [Bacteroidales bacterium]|jgi:hypothetical protein|nr:hypothetical protein [Bacteroidales bacterium]
MTKQELYNKIKAKGYQCFDDKINIIGVRSSHTFTNLFDDYIYVSYKDVFRTYPCTTDPGSYYMQMPKDGNAKGVAVLKPNQYIDTWQFGLHKGQYKALVQAKPVTVYRDANTNNIIDYTKEDTGLFGINIHKAGNNSAKIDNWSAGCQVFKIEADFSNFINICESTNQKFFTYTLLDLNQ